MPLSRKKKEGRLRRIINDDESSDDESSKCANEELYKAVGPEKSVTQLVATLKQEDDDERHEKYKSLTSTYSSGDESSVSSEEYEYSEDDASPHNQLVDNDAHEVNDKELSKEVKEANESCKASEPSRSNNIDNDVYQQYDDEVSVNNDNTYLSKLEEDYKQARDNPLHRRILTQLITNERHKLGLIRRSKRDKPIESHEETDNSMVPQGNTYERDCNYGKAEPYVEVNDNINKITTDGNKRKRVEKEKRVGLLKSFQNKLGYNPNKSKKTKITNQQVEAATNTNHQVTVDQPVEKSSRVESTSDIITTSDNKPQHIPPQQRPTHHMASRPQHTVQQQTYQTQHIPHSSYYQQQRMDSPSMQYYNHQQYPLINHYQQNIYPQSNIYQHQHISHQVHYEHQLQYHQMPQPVYTSQYMPYPHNNYPLNERDVERQRVEGLIRQFRSTQYHYNEVEQIFYRRYIEMYEHYLKYNNIEHREFSGYKQNYRRNKHSYSPLKRDLLSAIGI